MALTSDRLAIALVFVAVAVLACLSPAQSDTWWHLRLGQDTWQTHAIPTADTYSYTAAGHFFTDHGWLTGVIFYGLFTAGGMPLVAAGCAAIIVCAWWLAWRMADGPFEVTLLALLAALVTSTGSWALRAQVFSMVMLAATAWLLVRRRLTAVPVVFLLWANLHAAVALGLAAVLGAAAAATIRERRVDVPLVICTGLCALAMCVTPLGLRYWPEILESMRRSSANNLIEWSAPGLSPQYWPFWAMGSALLVGTLIFWRRLDGGATILAGMAVALLPLAARSVRNVPMFMLVAVPTISRVMSDRAQVRPQRLVQEQTRLNAFILGVAVAVGVAVVTVVWVAKLPMLGWQPLSAQAIHTMAVCPDPIYNTFNGGGELIWFVPQKKVFIDNRQDPYPAELLAADHQLESDGRYQSLFSAYAIRCAIAPADTPTTVALSADPAWVRSYADARWEIFTRR